MPFPAETNSFLSPVGSHLSQTLRPKKSCRAVFLQQYSCFQQGSFILCVAAEHYKALMAQGTIQGTSTHFQLDKTPQLFPFHSTPVMEIPFFRGSSQEILTCQWQVEAAFSHALFITLSTFVLLLLSTCSEQVLSHDENQDCSVQFGLSFGSSILIIL